MRKSRREGACLGDERGLGLGLPGARQPGFQRPRLPLDRVLVCKRFLQAIERISGHRLGLHGFSDLHKVIVTQAAHLEQRDAGGTTPPGDPHGLAKFLG